MQVQLGLGVVILSIGVIGFIAGARATTFALASRSWPTAPGIIRAVTIGFDDEDRRYEVRVEYTYRIDGQEIPASNFRFGDSLRYWRKAAAEQYLQRYRPGQAHPVRIDPAKPTRSVLVPGLSPANLIGTGVSCLLIAWGATIVLRTIY